MSGRAWMMRLGDDARPVWPAAPLAGLGGLGFAAVFRIQDIWWPVLVAAVAGTGAWIVNGVLSPTPDPHPDPGGGEGRDGASWPAGLAALAVVGLGGMLALRASPVVLVEGLRAQRRLLEVALPAPSDVELLAVPYLYTVVGAFLGAASRSGPRTGTATRLLPALPSAALLVVALAFGGFDGLARATWVPPAWAAAVLLTCSGRWSSRPSTKTSAQDGLVGLRRLAGAVVTAAVVAIVAVPVSDLLPARGDDGRVRLPRSAAPQPQQGQGNPLSRVTALQKGPNDLMFTAEASSAVEHWRLVVLDRYDGESWEHAADYRVAGRHLPDAPHPPPIEPGSVTDVDATIELSAERDEASGDAPWGRWLPVAERATELAVDGVLFDAVGGTAVVDAGRPLPDRYDAAGEIRQPDDGALPGDHAAGDAEARSALRLPDDIPDAASCRQAVPGQERPVGCALRQFAQSVVETADSDYARAAAIQSQLMDDDNYRLMVDDPVGGHTVGHLDGLVAQGTDGDDDPAYGSVEQFVATYALVARMVGLPSRVVVGFRGELSPGRHQVRAHDAAAWAEVKFAGVGWVEFDPVPEPDVFVPTPDEQDAPVDHSEAPVATVPEGGEGGRADDDDRDHATDDGPAAAARRWAWRAFLLVLLVGVPMALAAREVRRWRRLVRRRSAIHPPTRVAGAWQAALDELRLAGVDVTNTQAVGDLVQHGRVWLGALADPLVPLGALANRSRFASTGVTDADADAAWKLSDAFVAAGRQDRIARHRVRVYLGLPVRPAPSEEPRPATFGRSIAFRHGSPHIGRVEEEA